MAALALPAEVAQAMRRSRYRYAWAVGALYSVACLLAILITLWLGAMAPAEVPRTSLTFAALLVALTLVRPLWIHKPVERALSVPPGAAADMLCSAMRGRMRARPLSGGILVEGGPFTMPAWFVDAEGGARVVTTTGTALHLRRSAARPVQA